MTKKIFSDIVFFKVIVIIFGAIGCLTVFAATNSFSSDANFAVRQFTWFLLGILIMEIVSRRDFNSIMPILDAFLFISPLLLWLVLVFGVEVNGMRGWFKFGSYLFQPSEFAKPFFAYALCKFFTLPNRPAKQFFTKSFILLLSFILPILLQPDYGMTFIYLITYLVLVFLLAENLKLFSILTILFLGSFAIFSLSEPYVLKRIYGYLSPFQDPQGAGWHILQFKYTIARGGVSGVGWGNSLWANAYLPLPHSDSAFATISEASGLFGTLPIILIFSILPAISANFAKKQPDDLKSCFIIISFFLISYQGLIHILVNLGLIPPTGLTLPLLSYGGSSIFSTMLIIGLIISAINSK